MKGFVLVAALCFGVATMMGFGWFLDKDPGRAVGLIAAGLLSLVLSSIPVGPVT